MAWPLRTRVGADSGASSEPGSYALRLLRLPRIFRRPAVTRTRPVGCSRRGGTPRRCGGRGKIKKRAYVRENNVRNE